MLSSLLRARRPAVLYVLLTLHLEQFSFCAVVSLVFVFFIYWLHGFDVFRPFLLFLFHVLFFCFFPSKIGCTICFLLFDNRRAAFRYLSGHAHLCVFTCILSEGKY